MPGNDLNTLLVATEQVTTEMNKNNEPHERTKRTLKQLWDSSNQLFYRVSSAGPRDTEATLLLSSKGVDLSHLSKKVENIRSYKMIHPTDPFPVSNISNYLNNEKENCILSMISETHKTFDTMLEDVIDVHLDKEASKLRDNLLTSLHALSDLSADTPIIKREFNQDSPLFAISSPLNQHQILYTDILIKYNTAMLEGKNVNLIEKFVESSAAFNDGKIKKLWNIVSHMSQIPPVSSDDVLESRLSPVSVEKLIKQARSYLEAGYKTYMENVISNNILLAQRGGIPGTYSLALAFVKVRITQEYVGMEHIFVDGVPFWPVCYFCVRSNDVDAALHAIVRSEGDLFDLSKALTELKESPNQRVSYELAKLFKSSVRNSSDPYKRILYCILGSAGINDQHPQVINTADDYLWYQLCLVRQPKDYTAVKETCDSEFISYNLLQSIISEQYGETYFRASEQPIIYFQMLFLTGQFELAIDHLFRNETFYSHAVHIAIALHEQGLLALPDRVQRPLLSSTDKDPAPMKRLNLCTLVKMYIKMFQENDPHIALHYCFCLRNIVNNERCMFADFVCQLALETEQYDSILGYLQEDGCRIHGYLDTFANCGVTAVNDVIKEVALTLKEKGNYFEAVKLFNVCDDYEDLLIITNNILSEEITNLTEDESRIHIINFTEKLLVNKCGAPCTAHPNTIKTFNRLNAMFKFFKLYQSKQRKAAINIINELNLIPLQKSDVQSAIENFKTTDPLILRTIGDVLIAAMKIICEEYKENSSLIMTMGPTTSVETNLKRLREHAEAILSFAGNIPFQLPADTNNKLVQLKLSLF